MRRRVRVMQVVHSLDIGGSEKLAATIASSLDADRFDSLVCALTNHGPLSNELREKGIRRFAMGKKPGLDVALVMRLCCLFRRERVDIVQTHHAGQLLYSLPAAMLARVGTVVHTEHEQFSFQNNSRLRWLIRVLSRFVGRIVCVGHDVAEYLMTEAGVPSGKVETIRNGIDTVAFAARAYAAKVKRHLGCGEDDFVFGNVSRLNPVKDHSSLIRAFAAVRQQGTGPVKLVLIGDGEIRRELETLVASFGLTDFVRFLGARTDVPELLPGFDTFVLSSYNEGLPLALLEAMSCCVPVIGTSVGSVPTVIRHRENGLLVPPKDTNALAAAMLELSRNSPLRSRLGEEGRRTVEREFSLKAMIRRYEAVFEEALSSGREARSRASLCRMVGAIEPCAG